MPLLLLWNTEGVRGPPCSDDVLPGVGDGEAEAVELGSPGLGDLETNSNKLPANRSSVTWSSYTKTDQDINQAQVPVACHRVRMLKENTYYRLYNE